MRDRERKQWVKTDADLHLLWQQSGLTLDTFVRENRNEIDRVIYYTLIGERASENVSTRYEE